MKLGSKPEKRDTDVSRAARKIYAEKLLHNRQCKRAAKAEAALAELRLDQEVRSEIHRSRFTTSPGDLRLAARASRDQAQRAIRKLSKETEPAQSLADEKRKFEERFNAECMLKRARRMLSAIAQIPKTAISHFKNYQERFAHGWKQHQSAERSRAVAQFRQYEQETSPIITAAENRTPGFDDRDGTEPGFSM